MELFALWIQNIGCIGIWDTELAARSYGLNFCLSFNVPVELRKSKLNEPGQYQLIAECSMSTSFYWKEIRTDFFHFLNGRVIQ